MLHTFANLLASRRCRFTGDRGAKGPPWPGVVGWAVENARAELGRGLGEASCRDSSPGGIWKHKGGLWALGRGSEDMMGVE